MNYTRAAEKLGLTQPAVSGHIKMLEEEYGVKLFSYSGKKLALTKAGEILRRSAVTLQHDETVLKQRMGGASELREQLRFGATKTAGPYAAAFPLCDFLKRNDDVNVKLVIDDTKNLLELLDGGEIDFALVEGSFPRGDYESVRYSEEPFCAVAAPGHVFRKRGVRRAEDLLGERLLIREVGSGTRDVLEAYLKNENLSIEDFPNIVEINDLEVLKTLAEEDCGITFLYETAVEKELEEGLLEKIKIKGFAVSHDFSIIRRKGSIFPDSGAELFG
jgi:DNA-binding transcriptional LysR family regulator